MKIDTLKAITSYTDKSTLVLTDINNTLITKVISTPSNKLTTQKEQRLIEKITPEIIKRLQGNGICVMALTIASPQSNEKTKKTSKFWNRSISQLPLANPTKLKLKVRSSICTWNFV